MIWGCYVLYSLFDVRLGATAMIAKTEILLSVYTLPFTPPSIFIHRSKRPKSCLNFGCSNLIHFMTTQLPQVAVCGRPLFLDILYLLVPPNRKWYSCQIDVIIFDADNLDETLFERGEVKV